MLADAGFLFVVCQVGAETALKRELARDWPQLRLAFSRPGFVTFKLPAGLRLTTDFDLRSTFARAGGFSLGKLSGTLAQDIARGVWPMASRLNPQHLHVWERDRAVPGEKGFEPGITPLAREVAQIIASLDPRAASSPTRLPVNQVAEPGQCVLDCVLVEPNEWWIGYHVATSWPARWPGGVPPLEPTGDMISRAYLKVSEALEWSQLPAHPGDLCAEIGSSPGGASQALLDRKLTVLGIDPAEMDERILAHPQFTHFKRRAADLKRREFRRVKWLFADSNVTPPQALDSVEAIVTHQEIRVRGMLLTLKLVDWQLAGSIPDYVQRVHSWGFDDVRTRQLAFNRREFCLAALKSRGGTRIARGEANAKSR
jgi:23S rRNA (cytidine2498-2'-O)-methyltransferase